MAGRAIIHCRRLLGLALPAAAPGLVILAGLALAGVLSAGLALVLGIVAVLATVMVLGRLAIAVGALAEMVAYYAADASPPPLARRAPVGVGRRVDNLRLALQRLARLWQERAAATKAALDAAEAIIESAPDPLLLVDNRRRILRANAAAIELVGALSPPCDLASALRNPALLMAADAVLRGAAARTIEFTMTVPIERQLRARLARVADASSDRAAAVVMLHDVTELKRAEQARADFIANASHELRTPLATLTGFIETLRGPARDDPEARERFLAIMGGEATRMSRLVEDLLSLSRIELNEHVAPHDRVSLAPLLQHLAEALALRAAERGMRIALTLPSDLPDVQGDRDELAQVFQNLLDNAIKYGRPGTEISVVAESVQHPGISGGRSLGSLVSVAVRDRGDGIAREHLPRLTERFYRVDSTRSHEMGGTGLGLAIVKHIVSRHRGLLEVASTLSEGSVFTVSLRPYTEGSPRAQNRSNTHR